MATRRPRIAGHGRPQPRPSSRPARRIEGALRLAAPFLDLLLAAGDRLSRLDATGPESAPRLRFTASWPPSDPKTTSRGRRASATSAAIAAALAGAVHLRRHRLAPADALRPAAPRAARVARRARPSPGPIGALRVAARSRTLEYYDDHALGVLLSSVMVAHRLRRARLGAHLPRGRDARPPARVPAAARLPAARRRHPAGRSRRRSRALGTNLAIKDFLDGPRTVDAADDVSANGLTRLRPAARAARRARPRARARVRVAQRDARRPAHPLHGRAGDDHRRAARSCRSAAAAGRAVLLAAHARVSCSPAAGRAGRRRRGGRATPSRGRASAEIREQRAARGGRAPRRDVRAAGRRPSRSRSAAGPSPSASARKRKRKRR